VVVAPQLGGFWDQSSQYGHCRRERLIRLRHGLVMTRHSPPRGQYIPQTLFGPCARSMQEFDYNLRFATGG